jgi:hypothetical protein
MDDCVFPQTERPPCVSINVWWASSLVWIYEARHLGKKGMKNKSWFPKQDLWVAFAKHLAETGPSSALSWL